MLYRPMARLVDRRVAERLHIATQVFIRFTGPHRWAETDAMLVDISSEGMRIRCDRKPQLTQDVRLGFLWQGHGLCGARGRPLRIDDDGCFVVRFATKNHCFDSFLSELHPLNDNELKSAFENTQRRQVLVDG